jgi:hypothetical protein
MPASNKSLGCGHSASDGWAGTKQSARDPAVCCGSGGTGAVVLSVQISSAPELSSAVAVGRHVVMNEGRLKYRSSAPIHPYQNRNGVKTVAKRTSLGGMTRATRPAEHEFRTQKFTCHDVLYTLWRMGP